MFLRSARDGNVDDVSSGSRSGSHVRHRVYLAPFVFMYGTVELYLFIN